MVSKRTPGIDKDSWYRQGFMVLTTPMVLTKTHGIESVLLNHTRTRGPSVTRMRDFFFTKWWSYSVEGLLSTGPTPSSLFQKYAIIRPSVRFRECQSNKVRDLIDLFPQKGVKIL